jgi:hypothetical protein
MTISKIKAKKILILFTLAALSAASVYTLFQNKSSAAGFNGALYTTTFSGQSVNENTYSNKDEVYINGGPQNANANGLPDGTYYFQVTDPSGGTLLSTDPAVCRQLIVANGRVAASEGPACQHSTGIPNSSNGSTPVKLSPFNDTPNSGSEYKVWLIRQAANTTVAADGMHINFSNTNAKTDNFKVVFIPCTNCSPTVTLGGKKFYDVNGNTLFDDGEEPVAGVQFVITITTGEGTTSNTVTSGASGNWSFVVPTGAVYEVGEYLPYTTQSGSYWVQTAPVGDGEGFQGYRGTANGDQFGLNFGDICYGPDGTASTTPCGVSYTPPPPPSPTPTPTPCTDNCQTVVLSGHKFYDANHNALFDSGEVPVQGVRIAILITTYEGTTTTVVTTDASGDWNLTVPTGTEYLIGEYVPDTDPEVEPGSYWMQTAPAGGDEGFQGYIGTANENQSSFNFGDICYHPDGEGNPVASATPCTVYYPRLTSEPPPDNQ